MSEDTTARSARKVLKTWFNDDADTLWRAYTKRWMAADKQDKLSYLREFDELLERCAANGFPISYATGWALSVMACKHHTLFENARNRELTAEEEALRTSIEGALASVFSDSEIGTGSQYDPHGRTLRLILPDKTYSSWDGESWRIPIP